MNRAVTGLFLLLLGLAFGSLRPMRGGDDKAAQGAWRALFTGKDLAGWDTWLGRPHKSVAGLDLRKNDKGEYTDPVGLNKDLKQVYTIVNLADGPAIRISGEIFGALTTQEEFENYHFKLDFRWGERRWPPRESAVRDSGILYHCVGEHGAAGSFWMQSQECQVQERDCGDYWSVAGAILDVEADLVQRNPASPIRYRIGALKHRVPRTITLDDGKTRTDPRIIKGHDAERRTGEWNTIEVLCFKDTSVHVVNGQIVMILTGSRRKVGDREVPLTKGRIQIQSEGAEVFYKNIEIKPIRGLFGG
jgi:hypothetical protein